MPTRIETAHSSKAPCSGIMSGLVVLFLVFDGIIKLVPVDAVTDTMAELGWPPSPRMARGLGILTLLGTGLYTFPPNSVLGAVLLTGYLGGAMAAQLRLGSPVLNHLLFGLYLRVLVSGAPRLRDGEACAHPHAVGRWR